MNGDFSVNIGLCYPATNSEELSGRPMLTTYSLAEKSLGNEVLKRGG